MNIKASAILHLRMATVLCLFLLAGCQTYKPAITVTPQEIRNPSLGFKGYALQIPPGFVVRDVRSPDDAPRELQELSQLIRQRYAMSMDFDFNEAYWLENKTMAILFEARVERMRINFGEISEQRIKDVLYRFVEGRFHPPGMAEFKLNYITLSPDHVAAKVTFIDPKNKAAYEFRIIPGRLKEDYVLHGATAQEKARQLTETMDVLVGNFQY